ncbi:hypothetical protein CLV97_1552 [Planifilum fimeticola]|uniref:Uncharacterized protein n=1 Tax=Planifilum fimeticola TaxID=201975 RepID=A0A2T0L9Y5_9BACL|nr:hypothetical protein [Planifilum fimeticola]PRX38505.1 hypothetical protein CLV97_1552 [Planifilum fimeticola]
MNIKKSVKKRVPDKVIQTVERYKRRKEKYHFLPCGIEYRGETYYYVEYYPNGNPLVVRGDGTVPYFDEVKKVIELAPLVTSVKNRFYYKAKHLLRTRTTQSYRHILSLLEKIEQELQYRLSPELREDLETFRQVSKFQIEKRREMEDAIAKGKALLDKVFQDFRATEEEIKEMRKLQLQVVQAMYDRNQAQLQSFEKRERLMRALVRYIPPWKILTWMRYLMLLFYHRNMMNQIRPEDKRLIQQIERSLQGKYQDSDLAIYNHLFRTARNPRIQKGDDDGNGFKRGI